MHENIPLFVVLDLRCLVILMTLMEACVCECQESRIGKAVEVMIQHVENLRRMYTKEHAELLELRETLMQNERSFGSHTERGRSTQST